MNEKKLHRHAVPIIILSTGLFIVSIIGLNNLIFAGKPSNDTVGRALTERLIRVTPASNGLFHVSRYRPNDVADSRVALDRKPSPLTGIANTGKVAQLEVTVNALAQTNQ